MTYARGLIKEWKFFGEGKSPSTAPYSYIFNDDVKDGDGVAGQGNGNPPAKFIRHFIVQYNGLFYDPSYGGATGGPFNSQEDWENASVAGFCLKKNSILFVKPNNPDKLETTFIIE